jgi:hypothetical protein
MSYVEQISYYKDKSIRSLNKEVEHTYVYFGKRTKKCFVSEQKYSRRNYDYNCVLMKDAFLRQESCPIDANQVFIV